MASREFPSPWSQYPTLLPNALPRFGTISVGTKQAVRAEDTMNRKAGHGDRQSQVGSLMNGVLICRDIENHPARRRQVYVRLLIFLRMSIYRDYSQWIEARSTIYPTCMG